MPILIIMAEYRIIQILRELKGVNSKTNGLYGNLVAQSGIDDNAVLLQGTEGYNLFTFQKVSIKNKENLETLETDFGIEYISNDFEMDNFQRSIKEFEDEISKIFEQSINPEKRILYAKKSNQSKWNFPLIVVPNNRDRYQISFNDFPNIMFEYKLPDSEISLVGFMHNSPLNLENYFERLNKDNYKIQDISLKLGEGLREPNNNISLVERIAKGYAGK